MGEKDICGSSGVATADPPKRGSLQFVLLLPAGRTDRRFCFSRAAGRPANCFRSADNRAGDYPWRRDPFPALSFSGTSHAPPCPVRSGQCLSVRRTPLWAAPGHLDGSGAVPLLESHRYSVATSPVSRLGGSDPSYTPISVPHLLRKCGARRIQGSSATFPNRR